ncbi:MAG: hypothetical protein KC516_00080 [Nanoarchaeota archaeon]|nr:hypothetical protein [Nanoarchaeota archaeon]
MLDNLLREIVTIVVGKQAEPIADLLNSGSHVNEFIIAKKLDVTINQTRNILYKISNFGLVSSIRKKDKKKGWYTYFWKFEILKCLEFLREIYSKKFDELTQEIRERNEKRFYVCERCNIEMEEEEALAKDFACEECGDLLTVKDSSKVIKDLERNLSKIKEKMDAIDVEIEKEKISLEKIKLKEIKKAEKEKEKKKEAAKIARRVKKKASEKTVKKKTVKKKTSKKKTTKKKTPKKKTVKKKTVKKKTSKKKTTKKK